MVINIVELLIKDTLELYEIQVDKPILEGLSTFYSFPNTRILGILNENLFVEDVIRLSMSNKLTTALIHDERISVYYSEESNHEVFNVNYHENLPLLSVETGIPLSRLTLDYKSLLDLNPSYLEKLELVKQTIQPALDFLILNQMIIFAISYDDKIREFLANAIN